MPELPEVEVLRRYLDPALAGRVIQGVEVRKVRLIRPSTPAALREALLGARFESVTRRAKFLIFTLADRAKAPRFITGHLGMTGRMYLQANQDPLPKHAAVVLDLGEARFVYEDPRGFGRWTLEFDPTFAGIGPEPLSEAFTVDSLLAGFRGSSLAVKVKLLDQSVVAGIGNIYASEALFRAGIPPRRAAKRVSAAEGTRLCATIREVLSEAIELGSSMRLGFAAGNDGLFYYGSAAPIPGEAEGAVERFRVYDRAGQPCVKCGSIIRRIVQAQRSTFYCPSCQR